MTAPEPVPGRPVPGAPIDPPRGDAAASGSTFDPLRLCVFTTVALLAWLLGPFAVLAFAILGLAGYWKAHRAGLTRSRCYLRDVRLVLAYLSVVAVLALAGCAWQMAGLIR